MSKMKGIEIQTHEIKNENREASPPPKTKCNLGGYLLIAMFLLQLLSTTLCSFLLQFAPFLLCATSTPCSSLCFFLLQDGST